MDHDGLLCDEVLDFTPPPLNESSAVELRRLQQPSVAYNAAAPFSREEFEEAVRILVENERKHMPEPGYADYLQSNTLVYNARFKAVHWIIGSQKRLSLSPESIFCAANYIDRFISLRKCEGWECCIFDLLSIACLYVASKFNETHLPSLHAIQMEGIEHPFEDDLVRRMELSLVEALGWKMKSITPYSYLQLVEWNHTLIPCNFTVEDDVLMKTSHAVTEMLLGLLFDPKFLEFRPSVVAEATLQCVLKDVIIPSRGCNLHYSEHFTSLLPQDQQDGLKVCLEMMNKRRSREETKEECESSTSNNNHSIDVSSGKRKREIVLQNWGGEQKRVKESRGG
ncbi:unnamed protein product [Cuscuta epithymum]|uniref:Cyclin-like domain-containing protein n=1 Tax=Cuscuta epithymum TaxID=186058 RepID=A0AAV0F8I5_9ASTE|nr:unnamed protein product [Cuscuta epithymum]